jgi:hypothetical protein
MFKIDDDKLYDIFAELIDSINNIDLAIQEKYKIDGMQNLKIHYGLALSFVESLLRNAKFIYDDSVYLDLKKDFQKTLNDSIDKFDKNEKKHPYKGKKTYLFSKELRNKMSKYDHLSAEESLNSPEFMRDLLEHGKVPEEEINELLKFMKKE